MRPGDAPHPRPGPGNESGWAPTYPPPQQPAHGAPSPWAPPPPHTPPAYGAPAPGVPAQRELNVFAILSLVAGIAGLSFVPLIGSVIAIIFASIAKNELARRPDQHGVEYANWGSILGIVGVAIWVLIMLLGLFITALFGGMWTYWWTDWMDF